MSLTITNAQTDLLAWAAFYAVIRKHHEEIRYRSNLVSRNTVDPEKRVQQGAQGVENQHKTMPQSSRVLLNAALREFGPFIGSSSTDTAVLLSVLYTYMLDNSIEIKSRGTVYGAAANAGGNTGNQVLLVCSKNASNQVVESATIETLTFKCEQQAANRQQLGQEVYTVSGAGRGLASELDGVGRGIIGDAIAGFEPGVTGLLDNASFDQTFSGTGTDKIPGWTIAAGTAGDITRDTTNVARDRGAGNHASLKIVGDVTLRFYFRTRGKALTDLLPYIGGCRWRADGSNGNVVIGVGSNGTTNYTKTQATSNQATFQDLRLDPDTQEAWKANFDTDANPYFEVKISSYSSGNIWIDDALFSEMLTIGGRYVCIASGVTAALDGDTHTQACTLTVGSGSVELASGASGSLDSITANGVELLSEAIPFNGSLAQTAQDAVDNINAKQPTNPEYVASLSTATVVIKQVVPVEGTITIASTATTISTNDTNITGASLGKTQDAIVRRTGGYLPHASSATSGWGDAA
jgi:hypothetical protein